MFFREQGSRNYVHVYCQANSYANDLSRTPPLNILIDLLKLINILDNKNNSALTKYDDSMTIFIWLSEDPNGSLYQQRTSSSGTGQFCKSCLLGFGRKGNLYYANKLSRASPFCFARLYSSCQLNDGTRPKHVLALQRIENPRSMRVKDPQTLSHNSHNNRRKNVAVTTRLLRC